MFTHPRPVRFQDVDAARIVFFARFLDYCHDAVEALFSPLPGGYPSLTMARDVGVPTVRLEVEYTAPLRYGDVAVIEVEALRVGRSSFTLRHTIRRGDGGEVCATVTHTMVTARLSALGAVEMPDDVRAILASHLTRDGAA
ncbi:MAG: acyl-CoA thioesterase [Polyangiales bacterium]